MDIYDALHADHEKLQRLLAKIEKATEADDETGELLHGLRNLLIPHSRAEEEVFYNSIRQCDPDSEGVLGGFREHVEAETLLRSLQGMSMIGVEWKAAARKLREAVEHHIEEEESRTFDLARRLFDQHEAEQLGEAFVALKPEVRDEGMLRNAMHLIGNLMPPRLRGDEAAGASRTT